MSDELTFEARGNGLRRAVKDGSAYWLSDLLTPEGDVEITLTVVEGDGNGPRRRLGRWTQTSAQADEARALALIALVVEASHVVDGLRAQVNSALLWADCQHDPVKAYAGLSRRLRDALTNAG